MNSIRHLFITAALVAQACESYAAESRRAIEELDQARVYGSRQDLTTLRNAVVEAEDRFFERYNELNTKDVFDVNCRREATTGTRLERRRCRPVYHERAVQEASKEGLEIRQRFQNELRGVMPRSPPVPAGVAIEARRPEFQSNLRKVVASSEELIRLLRNRAAAEVALEAAMRRHSEPGAKPSSDTQRVSAGEE